MHSAKVFLIVPIVLVLTLFLTQQAEGRCLPKGDLVIGLDKSGTVIKVGALDNVTAFGRLLVRTLDEDRYRKGVFYWDNVTQKCFSLAENFTKEEKINKIEPNSTERRSTHTGDALKYAVEMFMDPALPARPGVPKLIIWVSDGEDTSTKVAGSLTTADVMPSVNREGITIILVAVGNFTNYRRNIDRLTRNNSENVIKSSFDQLGETVVSRIEELTCYLPRNLRHNQSATLEAEEGEDSFVCCLDIKHGVTVNLTVLEGQLDYAVYSFTQRPKSITKENNDGQLYDSLEFFPRPKTDNGQLCALIVGKTHEFKFEMKCYQGDHSDGPYNEEGL